MLTLFTTDAYESDLDWVEFNFDFDELLYQLGEHFKAKNGKKLNHFACVSERSSHYGAICNNGQTGYRLITSLKELFFNQENFVVKFDEVTNKLHVILSDHDGVSSIELAPITKSKYEELSELENKSDFKTTLNAIQEQVINYKNKAWLY